MPYHVTFTSAAEKQLLKLDAPVRAKIIVKIESLALNPYGVSGVKALKGALIGICRARVGDYRIMYEVKDEILTILIVKIDNRKDAYR